MMADIDRNIISDLAQKMEVNLHGVRSMEDLQKSLSQYINDLVNHDFGKLVALLYRVDVSEKNLKENLLTSTEDAGSIIAHMIIERQIQKKKTRDQYKSNTDIPDDEKW